MLLLNSYPLNKEYHHSPPHTHPGWDDSPSQVTVPHVVSSREDQAKAWFRRCSRIQRPYLSVGMLHKDLFAEF